MRCVRLPLLLLLVHVVACATALDDGASCESDAECASGLCADVCLDPAADLDGDGLSNADELALGTDPMTADSDGDGRPDGQETGDADHDGRPDALESASADADLDCVPDELDPDDQRPADDATLLALHCPRTGVCTEAVLHVTCTAGVPRCDIEAAAYEPGGETRCDGLDNDCDGLTDEWTPLGPVGAACTSAGTCGAGVVECGDGEARCSSGPGGSASAVRAEQCNGLDDDCDGVIDDHLEGGDVGTPCAGTGLCWDGVAECVAGELRCSADPGGSSYIGLEEQCNGLDDDCDGATDELFLADGKPIGEPCGVGACAGGVAVCEPDGPRCSTAGLATPEQCNGVDDDCDGLTDEPMDLDPSAASCPTAGVCAAPLVAVPRCDDGHWLCEPGPSGVWQQDTEVSCDGLDNDCDGPTDESFSVLTPDLGPEAKALPVGSACGVGACAGGWVVCTSSGASARCTTLELASPEVCNGVDDDCDGLTDEDQTWKGVPLGASCSVSGPCGAGTVVCQGGQAICSTAPGGPASTASPELCNGVDDDCDGLTDELAEVAAHTTLCPAPGVCTEGAAVLDCVGGQLVCDPTTAPAWDGPEETVCDGLDNDCDGLVDEGLRTQPSPPVVLVDAGHPPPRPRWPATWDGSGRAVLVGGGGFNDVWRSSAGGWQRLSDVPGPTRDGASVTTSGSGRVVVMGGGDLPLAVLDSDDAWQEVPLSGGAGARRDAVLIPDPGSGLLWAFGGESLGAPEPVAAFTEGGEVLPVAPAGPGWLRGAAGTQVVSGADARIVLVGGELEGELTARIWFLDLSQSSWTPIDAAGPAPRRDHVVVSVASGLLLHGGRTATGPASDTWLLDPLTLTWSALPDGPQLAGHAAVSTPEGALVLGAEARQHRYDLDSMTWSSVAEPPHPKPYANATLTVRPDGELWLLSAAGGVPVVWRRSEAGEWSTAKGGVTPPPLPGAAGAADSDGLWLHGGGDSTTPSNGLWRYDGAWGLVGGAGPPMAGHLIASDPPGKRLIALTPQGEVWSLPKAAGEGAALETTGEAPPAEAAAWLSAPERHSVVLVGPGGLGELDLAAGAWRQVPTPPSEPWPTALVVGDALLLVRDGTLGLVSLEDGDWSALGPAPEPHLHAAAGALDPRRGRAYLGGGRDHELVARDTLSMLPFTCDDSSP